MSARESEILAETTVEIGSLDLRYQRLRLSEPQAIAALRRSLAEQGQLEPIVVNVAQDGTVLDGLKRLAALREDGRERVRVRLVHLGAAEAEAAIAALNAPQVGLTVIEEAWIVSSLCRIHELGQARVGELLGRRVAWVSRRLLLTERLDAALQDEIRLGLLSPTIARELGRLPRGKQLEAARCVREHGLSSRQAARLVVLLLACEEADAQDEILRRPDVYLDNEPISEETGDLRLTSTAPSSGSVRRPSLRGARPSPAIAGQSAS